MANPNVNLSIRAKNETQGGISSAIASLKSLDNQIGSVSKTFKALGDMAIFSAISAGVKKAIDVAIDCTKAYGDVERTMLQLKTALDGNEDRFSRLTTFIEKMAGKTTESKDSIEKLVAELASLGKSDTDIQKITQASIALSNVTGDSLESAFTKINATFAGTAGKLEKLVPELGNLSAAQLKAGGGVDVLLDKFGKISDSMSNGVTQKFQNLKTATDELKEAIGQGLAPVLDSILPKLTDFINKLAEGIKTSTTQASVGYDLNKFYKGKGNTYDVGRYATDINGYSTQEQITRLQFAQSYLSLPGMKEQNQEGLKLIADTLHELFLKAKEEAKGTGASSVPSTTSSSATPIKAISNASWGDVKVDNTPWALSAKSMEEAAKSMEAVNIELERQKYDHAYDTTGAVTSYSDGSGSGKSSGSVFGDILKGLDTSGITNTLAPLTNILSPIINNLGSFNIALAVLQPVMEGFTNVIGPALTQLIAPLMNSLKEIGGMLANAILPILEALTPFINLISQMLMTVLTPIINLIAASLSPIAAILTLLTPIIKACAIAIEVLTAPIRWIADLFTWVGGVLQTFVYNILHPFNSRGYSSFSSDAFSGLNDRIAAIINAGTTTLTPGSATTSYTGGSSPTYTGPQTLNVNIYQYGVYTDIDQVKKETTQAVFAALEEGAVYG